MVENCDLARAIDASNIEQHPHWSKLPDDLIHVILDILQMERSARAAMFGPCRYGYPGRVGQSVVSYRLVSFTMAKWVLDKLMPMYVYFRHGCISVGIALVGLRE